MAKRLISAIFASLLILVILQTVLVSLSSGEVYHSGQNLDFQLSATSLPQTAGRAQLAATYYLNVSSVGNFNSTVTLQITGGLPADTETSFAPSSVTPAPGRPAFSVLTITTTAGTPTGTYNITITGSSTTPHIVHSVMVTLIVVPSTHDFVLSTSQLDTPLVIDRGQCRNVIISVHAIASFNSSVSIFLSQTPPPDLTAQFSPDIVVPPMGGGADSNLQICVGPQANLGKYSMTIMANANDAGGTLSHSVDIVLAISPPPIASPYASVAILLVMLFGGIALAVAVVVIYLAFPNRSQTSFLDSNKNEGCA
jgi:hypothetical protein